MRERLRSKREFAQVGSKQKAVDNNLSTIAGVLPIVNCAFLSMLLIVLLLSSGCSTKEKVAEQYTCPMHPTVTSDKHGTCPVCGMDLVRKARAGEEVEITEDLAQLLQSPNEAIISNVSTIKGKYQFLPSSINVQGVVTYDTRYVYTIAARVGGRLENVFIKSNFQNISKGQKIVDIYSPELITAQRELLYLLNNDATNATLIGAAKEKLNLMGFTPSQTDELIKRKEPISTFSIYSSYNGYIISDKSQTPVATAPSAMNGGMDVGSTDPTTTSNENSLLRAGNYVNAGQTLFKIVNTSALRVELSLPATQANSIHVDDELELVLENRVHEKGKVDFIQPFNENGDELTRVWLFLSGQNNLNIGQFVNATIQSKATEALWFPAAAVLDLGSKQVVFIKDRGVFKPKEIKTGTQSNGWIEIKGLTSADEIASDAHYLVDSEDLIKTLN